MTDLLPINIEDLLHARTVESERIELKKSWDKKTTGPQVLSTICAFANDFHNLNGGYIVIGVAEADGRAILPPAGISDAKAEEARKWIRENANRIEPTCMPIVAREIVGDRAILVIRVPPSETRPHKAPGPLRRGEGKKYWIRLGSETVDAETNGQLPALLDLTARVPWDDRRALEGTVSDLREGLVREHLGSIRSDLVREPSATEIYRRLGLTRRINDHEIPRNVALLFFSERPNDWFPGAVIEAARFRDETGGDVVDERVFSGPLTAQFRDCLTYLEGLSSTHVEKQRHRAQVRSWVRYPIPALREALVNAIHHRSFAPDSVDPTRVYIYADRIVIASYPGPLPGIERKHLEPGAQIPLVPRRNRRIGDFLKELGLAEERLTGLRKIRDSLRDNGSPPPRFDFDPARTYFQVTLPAHPEFTAITALEDAAYARAIGDTAAAFRRVESAWRANPGSAVLAAELIRLYGQRGEGRSAEAVHRDFSRTENHENATPVTNTLIEVLADRNDDDGESRRKAEKLLKTLETSAAAADAADSAILARRLGDMRAAHRYFERAADSAFTDPRALHEFARTKVDLAGTLWRGKPPSWRAARGRLLAEAKGLLERVTQMEAPPTRHGWAWRDLGRVFHYLEQPAERDRAFRRAMELLPEEPRFGQEWERYRTGPGRR